MTDNLFNNTPPPTDFIAELTGPGKKFDRTKFATEAEMWQAVAKGKYESDSYIPILETQRDQMREDLFSWKKEADTRANLQELLDQMKKQTVSTQTQATTSQDNKPQLDPNQVQSLVSSEVQKLRAQERESENYNLVLNKLQERHGNNYASVLKQQAKELNLTDDRVNEMARKEPALFMRTFGIDAPAPRRENLLAPQTTSTVRNDNFRPQPSEVRDWNFYQKLKQEMGPKFYYDKKLAIQMHNDAMELGDRFRSGDFNESDKTLMQRLDNFTPSVVKGRI